MTTGFKAGEIYRFGEIPRNEFWSNTTFKVLVDSASGSHVPVLVIDCPGRGYKAGDTSSPLLTVNSDNLTLMNSPYRATALVEAYKDAKEEMDKFFEPLISKAVEVISYKEKYFDEKNYRGPWTFDPDYDEIVFVSDRWEDTWAYGGHETFGGYEVPLTAEFLADPDKVVEDARIAKEIRDRDDKKIADIQARNKVAKLERELEKARKELGEDN